MASSLFAYPVPQFYLLIHQDFPGSTRSKSGKGEVVKVRKDFAWLIWLSSVTGFSELVDGKLVLY